MHKAISISKKVTASGVVKTGACVFRGFLLGSDGVTDPVITIFDNITNAGEEIVPTCTYDGSALGLNGVSGKNVYCETGIYVEITGVVEVVVEYTPYYPAGELKWKG